MNADETSHKHIKNTIGDEEEEEKPKVKGGRDGKKAKGSKKGKGNRFIPSLLLPLCSLIDFTEKQVPIKDEKRQQHSRLQKHIHKFSHYILTVI